MKKAFAIIQYLSLDVAFGSLAGGVMAARMIGVEMPGIWWFSLPLSVWIIYTADHLLDAWRLKDNAHTARHLFHHRHFALIFSVWSAVALSVIIQVWRSGEAELFLFGMAMGLIVLLHFLLVILTGDRVSRFITKELGVGFIFTAGIWGSVWVISGSAPGRSFWFTAAQYFFLVMMNLLSFSLYERKTDELDGHSSFARALGSSGTLMLIRLLSLANVGFGMYLLLSGQSDPFVQIILGIMLLLLIYVSETPGYFGVNDRYRFWGDFAFLLPGLILLWPFA